MVRQLQRWKPDVVVYEVFYKAPYTQKAFYPMEVIKALKHQAKVLGFKLVGQGACRMVGWSNERLRGLGFRTHQRHATDALRHLLSWTARNAA